MKNERMRVNFIQKNGNAALRLVLSTKNKQHLHVPQGRKNLSKVIRSAPNVQI